MSTDEDLGRLGTVHACWRYPVKSLQGAQAEQLVIEPSGVGGDRTHAVIDPSTGATLASSSSIDIDLMR